MQTLFFHISLPNDMDTDLAELLEGILLRIQFIENISLALEAGD